MIRSRFHVILSGLALVLLVSAAPASAQTFGGRVGVSASPNQFYFGGHVETPPVADRIRFRPNVEIGVGDDLTLVAFNFELAYHFPGRNGWNVYAGGGPALNILNANSDTSSQGGLNFLVGVQHRDGLFFEVKAGAFDSPDFKVGVGYVFRRR
jgi:hypothetical protein